MPKVKLVEAEKYVYEWTVPLRITDMNMGGHLSNDIMLQVMHEARHRYVQSRGFKDERFAGVIVSDVIVNYKKEVFYNDILTVFIAFDEVSKISLRMLYKIVNLEKEVVALAETGIAFIDYQTRKLAKIPDCFL